MDLFWCKSIEQLRVEAATGLLKRSLGSVQLTMLGMGAMLGANLFVLTGSAAARYAGPSVVLSFLLAVFACALAGLCFAEFASMTPVAGSAYSYAYATFGELVAWLIGWNLILEYALGASATAAGWSGYVVTFLHDLGLGFPVQYATARGAEIILADGSVVHGAFNAPAAVIVLLAMALVLLGIRKAARTNAFIVLITLSVALLFIAFGVPFIRAENWQPFIPASTAVRGEFGWSGIVMAGGLVYFAYVGFDVIAVAAQEARQPQRDVPTAILGSLAICALLYVLVAAVLTGIVPYMNVNVANPLAVAANATGLVWLEPLARLGPIVGLASMILVLIMAQSRIFYSMAQDGLLPSAFKRIHPKFRTPHVTTLITGFAVAIVAGLFPIGDLSHMVAIGTLLAFAIVSVGVLVLRYRQPELERPFRTPGMPVVPILGALICLWLMYGLPGVTWLRLLIWLVIGLAIYFLYGANNAARARALGTTSQRAELVDRH